jgi:sugar phosphate isomerase/epimerase
MKLSCTSTMVPGGSLREKALKLAEWGYDGIAVFVDYAAWNEKLFAEVLSLKENTGVTPCEFVFMDPVYGHLMDKDEVIRKKARKMYKEAIMVCSRIGAITEMEYEYGVQDPLPLFNPYAQMSAEEKKGFMEMYTELAEVAKGTEAYVLIEPINRYESPYLNSLKDCQNIVEGLNVANIGLLADFFHMSIEERDLKEALSAAGTLIKHVHLGDNNRLLPGYGNIDWKGCIGVLKKIGFQGYLNLECAIAGKPEELLPRTAKFLSELIRR